MQLWATEIWFSLIKKSLVCENNPRWKGMLLIAIYQEMIDLEKGHKNLNFSIKLKIFKLQLSHYIFLDLNLWECELLETVKIWKN